MIPLMYLNLTLSIYQIVDVITRLLSSIYQIALVEEPHHFC